MLVHIFCAAGLALSVLAAPYPLQDCSFQAPEPCQCPGGTTFSTSTTHAVIAAAANDVKDITFPFFHTEWFGVTPVMTTGTEDEIGATRSLIDGTTTFVEELVSSKEKQNGAFTAKYQQQNVPLTSNTSSGTESYMGYWDTLKTKHKDLYSTEVTWHIYACFSKSYPFGAFHESAINNVTAILRSQGKIHGSGVPPYSE